MTLIIIIGSLVLSSFGQAGQLPKAAGGQASVEQVLLLPQSADPNRKGLEIHTALA